jgi:hypothetical protein
LWSTPVQIGIALFQLHQLLGHSVWAGAGTLFAVLFLQSFVIFGFVKVYLSAFFNYLVSKRFSKSW